MDIDTTAELEHLKEELVRARRLAEGALQAVAHLAVEDRPAAARVLLDAGAEIDLHLDAETAVSLLHFGQTFASEPEPRKYAPLSAVISRH